MEKRQDRRGGSKVVNIYWSIGKYVTLFSTGRRKVHFEIDI